MGVYFTIAMRNLVQARRRTILLGTALALVTMLLTLLMALSAGLTDTVVQSATTLSAGHVNVSGFYKSNARDAAPLVTGVDAIREIVETETPGLDYVIDRHRGWAKVVSPTGSIYAGLTGVEIAQEGRFLDQIQILEGDPKGLTEAGSALIFAAQAKRLDATVGDALVLSMETLSGQRNTGEVTVVAIAKDLGFMSNWNVFVSNETVRNLYQLREDTTGAVMVYLKDVDQSGPVMKQLREVFQEKGYEVMDHQPLPFWAKFETVSGEDWRGQKLDLTTWSDEVSFLKWVLTAFDTISFFLVAILLGIIAMGIMNTMWIAVRERTGEIGTLRAIGMHRRRVLLMFLLEALLLGLFATTSGAVLGAVFAALIDAAEVHVPWEALQAILMSDRLHLTIEPGRLVSTIVTFTLIAGASALWPALRAARMQPVTAIHRVG